MNVEQLVAPPEHCPGCGGDLVITEMQCSHCHTAVTGNFAAGRLINLSEPYASVLELFLKVRGNVKEMERKLGLSYPTIRARLEEAFDAAGFGRVTNGTGVDRKTTQLSILRQLDQGEISAASAAEQLRQLKDRG